MTSLTRQRTFESLRSWWSDSNLPGPTVNLHAAAKPLLRILYHRQALGIVESNSTGLPSQCVEICIIVHEGDDSQASYHKRVAGAKRIAHDRLREAQHLPSTATPVKQAQDPTGSNSIFSHSFGAQVNHPARLRAYGGSPSATSESKIELSELVWEILAQIATSAAGTDALVPQNALDLVETVLVPPVASVPFEPAACPVLRMLGGHKAANLIPRVVLLGFFLFPALIYPGSDTDRKVREAAAALLQRLDDNVGIVLGTRSQLDPISYVTMIILGINPKQPKTYNYT
ncbi:hypothetical protein C8J57DRAFT_1223098 [Mycena rebaudengoi]|nr:hypothetical protein C8J57DRAFT_1223098 [Mycena rebaudengoi]